jgi:hypothetical protein
MIIRRHARCGRHYGTATAKLTRETKITHAPLSKPTVVESREEPMQKGYAHVSGP